MAEGPKTFVSADDALCWLYGTQMFGIKLGLENTRRLLEAMGNPQDRLTILHVAGTNGKGSVCAMMDALLRARGEKAGLYTSPHLVHFSERIRVNGEPIPEPAIAGGLGRLRHAAADWSHSPTYFEYATALALWWFAENDCSVVSLETGMGGRLDATNIVDPVACVITPIAMDHARWLGDTLPEIAAEKAGILKSGRPAVSSPQKPEAATVLEETARRVGTPLKFLEKPWRGTPGLAGSHQTWNAALALRALELAGLSVDDRTADRALSEVRWPARFQRVPPDLIIDGAHNPHAAATLLETWRETFRDARTTVLFGCLEDKDAPGILDALEPLAERFLLVPVNSPRSRNPADLLPLVRRPAKICPDLPAALAEAHHGPTPRLLTGSLFLAGQALALAQAK